MLRWLPVQELLLGFFQFNKITLPNLDLEINCMQVFPQSTFPMQRPQSKAGLCSPYSRQLQFWYACWWHQVTPLGRVRHSQERTGNLREQQKDTFFSCVTVQTAVIYVRVCTHIYICLYVRMSRIEKRFRLLLKCACIYSSTLSHAFQSVKYRDYLFALLKYCEV